MVASSAIFAPMLAADFTLLHLLIPNFHELEQGLAATLPVLPTNEQIPLYNPQASTTLHLFLAGVSTLIVLLLATITRISWSKTDKAALPAGKFSIRELVESILDAVVGLGTQIFGDRKTAIRFLPLIGSLTLFIFISNLLALVPMMGPATDALPVTLAPAFTVFLATHIWGIKENGMGHIMHLFGPPLVTKPFNVIKLIVLPAALAFHMLFFVIEIISHIARPVSLSLRLMGNMTGDHLVLATFMGLVAWPLLFPVPILLLGTLVCIVQTAVFAILSMVYIALAIEQSEEAH